jgi:pyruvate,water dikinase
VWREYPEPVIRLAAQYREREDPARAAVERSAEREAAERELLAALSPARRAAARPILVLARRNVPLRGVGKASFLRAFDVTRSAARRVGMLLADDGALGDPSDVFYLTRQEILSGQYTDLQPTVSRRRLEREQFEQLEVPTMWRGRPVARAVTASEPAGTDEATVGLGVSAGIVEGHVRVVTDPTFEDVEPDEILVAPTTDPSWASILFLCKALVVDIGGHLSHAAVVARELGIPCVVDTKDGSKRLRTGDWVRVDGSSGRVEVLKPAP